jgi:NADH dehydrogenase [ubiquinone] 1 alpha subcomplex assembly factor 7
VSLAELITQKIRAEGPLTVADYMALCLTHPEHGYYQTQRVFGAQGDFTTAPEISQIFGDLIGFWCIDTYEKLGSPETFSLIELGPGLGTLMADVLRMIEKHPPMFAALKKRDHKHFTGKFNIHLVETSAQLREAQRQTLQSYQPVFHNSVASLLPLAHGPSPCIILANEFFDALPIHQFCGEAVRRIALDASGNFAFTPDAPVTRETCPAAHEILTTLAPLLQYGALLIVDYGYTFREGAVNTECVNPLVQEGHRLIARSSSAAREQLNNTLQAVRNHQYNNPLADPGLADLTAHVDFGALAKTAQELGLVTHGPVSQGAFLQTLGGDMWLQKLLAKASPAQRETLESGYLRLISPAQMGTLFKAMAISSPALTALSGF